MKLELQGAVILIGPLWFTLGRAETITKTILERRPNQYHHRFNQQVDHPKEIREALYDNGRITFKSNGAAITMNFSVFKSELEKFSSERLGTPDAIQLTGG